MSFFIYLILVKKLTTFCTLYIIATKIILLLRFLRLHIEFNFESWTWFLLQRMFHTHFILSTMSRLAFNLLWFLNCWWCNWKHLLSPYLIIPECNYSLIVFFCLQLPRFHIFDCNRFRSRTCIIVQLTIFYDFRLFINKSMIWFCIQLTHSLTIFV